MHPKKHPKLGKLKNYRILSEDVISLGKKHEIYLWYIDVFYLILHAEIILLDVFIFYIQPIPHIYYLKIDYVKKKNKNQYFNTFRTKNLICTYASTIQHGCEKKLIKKKMATES